MLHSGLIILCTKSHQDGRAYPCRTPTHASLAFPPVAATHYSVYNWVCVQGVTAMDPTTRKPATAFAHMVQSEVERESPAEAARPLTNQVDSHHIMSFSILMHHTAATLPSLRNSPFQLQNVSLYALRDALLDYAPATT